MQQARHHDPRVQTGPQRALGLGHHRQILVGAGLGFVGGKQQLGGLFLLRGRQAFGVRHERLDDPPNLPRLLQGHFGRGHGLLNGVIAFRGQTDLDDRAGPGVRSGCVAVDVRQRDYVAGEDGALIDLEHAPAGEVTFDDLVGD